MKIRHLASISLVVVLATACGQSNKQAEPQIEAKEETKKEPAQREVTQGEGEASKEVVSQAESTTALYCPSQLSIGRKTGSKLPGDATPLSPGEIVSGRIDKKDSTADVHHWRVKLAAGDHHIVVDTRRADSRDSNVGSSISLLDLDGKKLASVGHINEVDFRGRGAFTYNTASEREVLIRIEASFTVIDYHLGIFASGAKVPSPFFVDCPSVNPLVQGETAKNLLLKTDPIKKSAYYSAEISEGTYKVKVKFTRNDGQNKNVGGEVFLLDKFGSHTGGKSIARVNEQGFDGSGVGTLTIPRKDKILLMVSPSFADQKVEILLDK